MGAQSRQHWCNTILQWKCEARGPRLYRGMYESDIEGLVDGLHLGRHERTHREENLEIDSNRGTSPAPFLYGRWTIFDRLPKARDQGGRGTDICNRG